MRRFALAFAFLLCVAGIAAASACGATSKSAFEVFVEPTIGAASNGLTLETELEGSFDVAANTASGGGSYSVGFGSALVETGTFESSPGWSRSSSTARASRPTRAASTSTRTSRATTSS